MTYEQPRTDTDKPVQIWTDTDRHGQTRTDMYKHVQTRMNYQYDDNSRRMDGVITVGYIMGLKTSLYMFRDCFQCFLPTPSQRIAVQSGALHSSMGPMPGQSAAGLYPTSQLEAQLNLADLIRDGAVLDDKAAYLMQEIALKHGFKATSIADISSILGRSAKGELADAYKYISHQKQLLKAKHRRQKKNWVGVMGLKNERKFAHEMEIPTEYRERIPAGGEDWYTVRDTESIIFHDKNNKSLLAVIRDFCGYQRFTDYINNVIDDATDNHRNIQPTHPGTMIQAGWNAGPWHVHVWGLVHNLRKKFSQEDKLAKDRKMLGALCAVWNMIQAKAPREPIDDLLEVIDEAGMPNMAVEGDTAESGYTLFLDDGDPLTFETACKAPGEAYFTCNYSVPVHNDASYAPYTLAWFTHYEKHPNCSRKILGGNFIDVTLQVRVIAVADTLIIFDSREFHGTTLAVDELKQAGVTFAFSTHICNIYEAMLKAKKENILVEHEVHLEDMII
ncbi:hypothetical protein M422DRAFT_247176 [Sphaerobolus stellatus SS14]|nr:hypothetical protein M422DRAFT_247176 [Sphaerobolus stellatus SS14]